MKKCSKCHLDKDDAEFYVRKTGASYGHCRTCHAAMVRAGRHDVVTVPETKSCWICRETKPSADFSPSRNVRDGLHSYCKPCQRIYALCRKYGLTADDLRLMEERAQGKCECCGKERPLIIDHCHATGRVRGLICTPCNLILGHSKDDVDVLAACVQYLAS